MNDYQMEFGVTISYRKANMSKDITLHVCSYEESFKILPLYCEELKMTNPGTVPIFISQTTTDSRDYFEHLVLAFGLLHRRLCQ